MTVFEDSGKQQREQQSTYGVGAGEDWGVTCVMLLSCC